MDDTIVTLNINGIVTERTKGLLSNNGIIDKVLPNGVPVLERSCQTGKGGGGDVLGGNVALDNV